MRSDLIHMFITSLQAGFHSDVRLLPFGFRYYFFAFTLTLDPIQRNE